MSSVGSYSVLKKYIDQKRVIITMDRGIGTPTMIEKGSTLDDMRDDAITHLIMGAPLDQFDKFVADWKKLGGEDIMREMRKAYAGK
jgi:putative aldouronate transport system substrate-binding protein